MNKFLTFSLAIAFCASAYAEDLTVFSYTMENAQYDVPMMGLGISPNGDYVCGALENGVGIFVAQRESGDVKLMIPSGEEGGQLRHIDNNGEAIGFYSRLEDENDETSKSLDMGVTFSFDTGEAEELLPPDTSRYVMGECLTADGSIIFGNLIIQSFSSRAAYSTNRIDWEFLPVPSEEELGSEMWKALHEGDCAVKNVSADGNVVLGHLGSFAMPIIWIKNSEGKYEYDLFPMKYLKMTDEDTENTDKPLYSISAQYLNLSPNGRYASMLGLIEGKMQDGGRSVPVIYDTVNKEIIIYSEKQEIDEEHVGLYPSAIADNGTFIGTIGQPYFASFGSFIMEEGKQQAVLYKDVFPAYNEKFGRSDALGFNMPTAISANSRYILGYTFFDTDPDDPEARAYYVTYIIDRGEAVGVNEIASENAQPLTEVIYTIDGKCVEKPVKGINIVRKSDGTVNKIMIK